MIKKFFIILSGAIEVVCHVAVTVFIAVFIIYYFFNIMFRKQ